MTVQSGTHLLYLMLHLVRQELVRLQLCLRKTYAVHYVTVASSCSHHRLFLVLVLQVLQGKAFILKSLAYDSVHRADLFKLPCAPSKLEAYLARPDITISSKQPWILQEFLKVRWQLLSTP